MLNLEPNTFFDNKFVLVRRIGVGGFAEVWQVRRESGFVQALKIFNRLDREGLNIAREEFTKVYDLRHQRLLKPDDYGVYRNHPYLVLPYCGERQHAEAGWQNVGKRYCKSNVRYWFRISLFTWLTGLHYPSGHQAR